MKKMKGFLRSRLLSENMEVLLISGNRLWLNLAQASLMVKKHTMVPERLPEYLRRWQKDKNRRFGRGYKPTDEVLQPLSLSETRSLSLSLTLTLSLYISFFLSLFLSVCFDYSSIIPICAALYCAAVQEES